MSAQEEKLKQQLPQDEKLKFEEYKGQLVGALEINPQAKGYILVFKKGVLTGAADAFIRDYWRRNFGNPLPLIIQLDNPERDFKAIEVRR